MKNILTFGLAVVIIILGAFFLFKNSSSNTSKTGGVTEKTYKDGTYNIEGNPITLVDGVSELGNVGSSSKIATRYFGNETVGDLNGDGMPDVAFILTQSTGGTGIFYYAVVALKTSTGFLGTNGVFLGDRIAPQTTEIKDGQLVVNYATRNMGDAMTTPPSVGVTKYLKINGATLEESVVAGGQGARCGGNMTTAPVCASGYHCAPEPGSHLPFGDVGGVCIAN